MKWDKEAEILEEQFSERGLQFTSPFEGLFLMQAYGHLDGKRFHFRLKHGSAELCVGVYDQAAEMQKIRRHNEGLQNVMGFGKGLPAPEMPQITDLNLFPSVVLLASRIDVNYRPLVDVFTALIENLEPVKQANWN